MNIQPLGDRILIRPDRPEERTKSGIIIPSTAKKEPQKGVIVAAGPGTKECPLSVEVGDHVLYGEYSGTDIMDGDVKYLMMREFDLLAII